MLTVNLEKKLLKQNAKILSATELLNLKEYDRLGSEVSDSEILTRIGINTVAKEGKKIKNKIASVNATIAQYDRSRVFHISQIKSLCNKYRLRFLPTKMFLGSVDPNLTKKINQFEIASNVRCDWHNCFIVAPSSSFKLEEKPKDPLFFCEITDDYYYLIHKWGNDLSILNRVKAIVCTPLFVFLVSMMCSMLFLIFAYIQTKEPQVFVFTIIALIISLFLSSQIEEHDFKSRYN